MWLLHQVSIVNSIEHTPAFEYIALVAQPPIGTCIASPHGAVMPQRIEAYLGFQSSEVWHPLVSVGDRMLLLLPG